VGTASWRWGQRVGGGKLECPAKITPSPKPWREPVGGGDGRERKLHLRLALALRVPIQQVVALLEVLHRHSLHQCATCEFSGALEFGRFEPS